jgi:hypothetical protein
MSRKKIFVTLPLVVGLLAVGWFVLSDRPDPLVVRAIELAKEMSADDADPELFDMYLELIEGFSPEQIAAMERLQQEAHTKELKRFFALSDEEQQAELDAVIDQQNASRKKYMESLKKSKKTKVVAKSAANDEPRERPTYTPSQLTPEAQELRTRYVSALMARRFAREKIVRR